MPISFDSERKIFKLDTATSSYVIEIYEQNYLTHLYYGAKIPDTNLKNHKFLMNWFGSVSPQNINIKDRRFSPDVCTFEYPCEGTGDFRPMSIPSNIPARGRVTSALRRFQ